MHETFEIGSSDYEDPTLGTPRVLFVSLMPSFLRSLDRRFKEEGFRTKLFLYKGASTREMVRLIRECDKADIIFCEFVQTPIEIIADSVKNKPVFARLWRCELYNPKFLDQVQWSNISGLFIPTDSVATKFKYLREGKLSPKIVKFKAPSIDLDDFPYKERDFSKEEINIGILGNVIPRKRQLLAAQMMLDLPENYRLSIGGRFKDQEYVTHIRDFIAKKGLSDRVRLLGEIFPKAVPDFLADCHVILGLSAEETGHYAIAEGMATGCFPVMSYWWGAEDIYPQQNVHDSYLKVLSAIRNWECSSEENKISHSKAARSYVKTYLNSKILDKNIVKYISDHYESHTST